MDTLKIKDNEFRVKKMSILEVLALKTTCSMKTVEDTLNTYNTLLERLEVKCKDSWLPVKEKNKDVFYPAGIENDSDALQDLISYFYQYLKEVFQKSNE